MGQHVVGNAAFQWFNSGHMSQRLPTGQMVMMQPQAPTGQMVMVQPQAPYVLAHPGAMMAALGSQQVVVAAPLASTANVAADLPTPLPSTVGTARRQIPVEVEVVSIGSPTGSSSPPGLQPLQLQVQHVPTQIQPQVVALQPQPQVVMTAQAPFVIRGQAPAQPHVPNRVPTISGVEHLDPIAVYNSLRERRCLLVDLRSDDRAAGLIEGALHVPAIGSNSFASRLADLVTEWASQELIVLTCQYSAHRAPQCANWYRQQAATSQRVAILSGGFRGWEATGLPVVVFAEDETKQHPSAVDKIALNIGTQFLESVAATQVTPSSSFAKAQVVLAPSPAREHTAPQPLATGATASQGVRIVQTVQTVQMPATEMVRAQPHGYVIDETGKQIYVPPACPNRVPTIAGIDHVDPTTVQRLMQENKCILIDLRGEDRAAGLIDGSMHVPAIDTVPFLTRVPELVRRWADEKFIIFTCQYSAHRAPQCANWYRQKANPAQAVGILSGGFRGWESVGLPVKALASGSEARAADQKALQLGGQFVQSAPTQEASVPAAVLASDVSA